MSMNGPPMIPIPPHIETLTAPLILGELFGTYLFGILSVQFYMYYVTFPNDSRYIKTLAYSVFFVESLSCSMSIYDTYRWFASGYGNMAALNGVYLSSFDTPMMEALVGAALQSFYCYRIFTLNKKAWPVVVLIALLALTEVTAGVYIGISVVVNSETILEAAQKDFTAEYILWASAAAADIVIAATMITILLRRRSGDHPHSAPYQRSDIIITKIINLIVETNLASSLLAVFIVCIHAAFPNTNWFTCPALILGRVYSNSLLLILNNRQYLRSMNQPETSSSQRSRLRGITSNFTPINDLPRNNVRIELETVTVMHGDAFSETKSGLRD